MLVLTRKISFSAGHFGAAAAPEAHGHNYVLEVSVAGPVDPVDGMVINIKDVDAALKALLADIDHRMLNSMPEFSGALPTTEKLAQALWQRLLRAPLQAGKAGAAARYVALKLEEHPGLYVELDGGNPAMVYLTRAIEFAASHRLHTDKLSAAENLRLYGKCNNPHGHGHNYVAEVTVRGEPDGVSGVAVDLEKFERLLKDEIDARFDHKHLNLDTEFFRERVPTAENIAIVIWDLLKDRIPQCRSGGAVELHRVRLIETARSWFDYYGS